MKHSNNLSEARENKRNGKLVNYVATLGVIILLYAVNLININVFDTSEIMISNRTAIEKISIDAFPKWIEDKEIIEVLINDINKNSFKESKSYLQNPSYILYLEIKRQEENFTKIFHASAYLSNSGEMTIYDKLAGKYYKGRISKETVHKLDTIFSAK